MVQWLRLRASNAWGVGSIPGQGTKIPHATRHGQNKKEKKIKEYNIHIHTKYWGKASCPRNHQEVTFDLGEKDGGRMSQAKERAFLGSREKGNGDPVLRGQRDHRIKGLRALLSPEMK